MPTWSPFGELKAQISAQERTIGATRIWALPNPSGLNARWTAASMAQEYARLRAAAEHPGPADAAR